MYIVILAVTLSVMSAACSAAPETETDITQLEKQLSRFERISFHPNLLPLILKNKDFIGLADGQVVQLKHWRDENYRPMVDAMNTIIRYRILFEEAALSPMVTADQLKKMQARIFELQRQVLDYKLSCRANILQTFNQDNWDGFYIIAADSGLSIPSETIATEFARFENADR